MAKCVGAPCRQNTDTSLRLNTEAATASLVAPAARTVRRSMSFACGSFLSELMFRFRFSFFLDVVVTLVSQPNYQKTIRNLKLKAEAKSMPRSSAGLKIAW